MTCKELVELVTEYLEGTLSPDERERFEAHLAICQGCTTYVEQMRQTIHLVSTLPDETTPPAISDELLRMFRDWKDRQP